MKLLGPSLLQLLCVVIFPIAVLAADVVVDSSTLLGFGSRDISGTSKETLIPATQFLGVTADKLADGNLSLHFYGWGRTDMADKSYNSETSTGSLTYGYFQYRFNQANANVRAGRFFIHEGIVNEQIDGVSFRTDLPAGFGLSAFGGATVHTTHLKNETSDGKGSTLYGGRANYRYKGLLDVGVSGVYESDAPTLTSTAYSAPAYNYGGYRRVGGDIWLTPVKAIDFIGHSSYNPETHQIAEHNYLLNYKPTQHLVLTGEFNQYHEKSFLYAWTMFSAANLNSSDKSSSTGVSASYEINKNLEVTGDYKHYSREFGSADRMGGEVRVKYKDNSVRGGFGYHYLNADEGFAITPYTSASYHELRCFAMLDTKSYFAAVDLLGDFFKEKIHNQNSVWETTATVGYHFTPALALSGDLSYGRNPQFTEEAKALLRLTYTMTYTGTGGKK